MKTVSATDAKQRLAALLSTTYQSDAVEREEVVHQPLVGRGRVVGDGDAKVQLGQHRELFQPAGDVPLGRGGRQLHQAKGVDSVQIGLECPQQHIGLHKTPPGARRPTGFNA